MANTSKPDQDLTSRGQDLPPSTKEKPPEDVVVEQENESKKNGSAVSTAGGKIQSLRNKKKSAKTRLMKAKNQLSDLLESNTINGLCRVKTLFGELLTKSKQS